MIARALSPLSERFVRCARRSVPLAVPVLLLFVAATASAGPVTGTYLGGGMGRRVDFKQNDRDRNAWAGTLRFKLDSGEELLAFCIQLNVGVRTNDRYKSDGPVVDLLNGCQIANVLDSYPASTAGSPDDAAARQLALWHFSDDIDLSTIPESDAALRDNASQIATEAAEGACPARRTTAPDLKLGPDGFSVATGRRVEFSVSADAQDAGQAVQVTVTGPAALDDGRQESSIVLDSAGAAVFGVTSTGVGDTTVTVKLPYRLDGGTVFSQIDESQPTQRLVLAEDMDLVAETSVSGTWTETPTETPAPATNTPVPATATRLPADAPTATATSIVPTATTQITPSALATSVSKTPKPGPTQPAPATTPIIPAQLPKTGGGPPPRTPWLAIGALFVALGVAAGAARRRSAARAG